MAKDPAVLFYYTDFLNGTKRMTFDQKGLYIELLCEQCDSKTGSISEEILNFILNSYEPAYGDSYGEKVLSKFEKDEKGFYNIVMREHINKRRKYTEGRKENLKGTKTKTHMKLHMEDKNVIEDVNKNVIKIDKIKYAEFVNMSEAEYNKLIKSYGLEFVIQCITRLDNYKGSNGKKYKSDYRAILSWVVDGVKKGKPNERLARGAVDADAIAAELKKYS